MRPRLHKLSDTVLDVAALGYDLASELDNPAPDLTMRRILADRLIAATRALTLEERQMLAKRCGR